ncbi:MAG: S-formylglutathione hydrolase [Rhodospirillaceae bacterium]|nr:S-formylglutathione hydrolase [Rhodospirillaceae bacterium]
MKILSDNKMFGGTQLVCEHQSKSTKTKMKFGLYLPPQYTKSTVPVLIFLSGLTCTHENVMIKSGAQRFCSEHGLAFLMPDTSPRGLDLYGEHEEYYFGSGASFYVDATATPWSENYQMYSYISDELISVIEGQFANLDTKRLSICGHSMGGHGALVLALNNPDCYQSVSALAPIVSLMNCSWGEEALSKYLGVKSVAWRKYDACALLADGKRVKELLVDQGSKDEFLVDYLKPDLLQKECALAGVDLSLRTQSGYDHSYYFVSSFISEHIQWAADRLKM